METAEWQRFEAAVAQFAQALDPTAEVLFDHHVPDRDTGEPRQCDAWINAQYGGHIQFSIYVSCKDRSKSRRKLGSPQIDEFIGEIRARGASMGVLYTNAGFSGPALTKAAKNGIPCCRLYRDEPADIPEAVWIKQFICRPSASLGVIEKPRRWPIRSWNDLFQCSAGEDYGNDTILDLVERQFLEKEREVVDALETEPAPPGGWQTTYTVSKPEWEGRLVFTVRGFWKAYTARTDGVLLDGSYSFNNQSFKGVVEGPTIDMQSPNPGPDWEEVGIDEIGQQPNKLVLTAFCGSIATDLQEGLGAEDIPHPPD